VLTLASARIDAFAASRENAGLVRARRLVALIAAAVWVTPAALAGAVALHVALDHHHHGEPAAPLAAAVALPGEAVVGHDGHEHRIEGDASPALRASRAIVAPPAAGDLVTVEGPLAAAPAVALAATVPPPPRAGPARLALLSTLRI